MLDARPARAARLAARRRARARLRRRARAHAARAARPARPRAGRARRCSTRRCSPPAGCRRASRPSRKIELAPRHPHRSRPPASCCCACWRSPRRTCRARSTTSTPSSCTTCASRSAARARCCASSRACTTRSARARLRDELKWAQTLTGPVRDLDVQLLEWDELVGLLAPERRPELEPLRALLARRRARELTQAPARVAQRTLRATLLAAWRALADGPPAGRREPSRARAADRGASPPTRIRKVYRRMVRDGGRDRRRQPGRGRCTSCASAARSCATCSSCSAARSRSDVVKPMVTTLKDLQDVLGRFQDRAVQIELLREVRDELARARRPGGADGARARCSTRWSPTSRRRAPSSPSASRRSRPAAASASHDAFRSAREGPRHLLDQGRRRQDVGGGQPRRARRARGAAHAALGPRPAGRSTFLFRVKPKVKGGGSKLVRGKRDRSRVIKGTDLEGLDLLPADFSYRHLDLAARQAQEAAARGSRACSTQLEDDYDLAILDCPPSISLVSESVFAAADVLLVPLVPVDAVGAHARAAARRSWPAARSRRPRCSRSSRWSTAASACTRAGSSLPRRSPASPRAAIPAASAVELMGAAARAARRHRSAQPGRARLRGAVGGAARRAQGLTTRRRPNARRKAPSEIRRSRLQTASRSSPRSRRRSARRSLDAAAPRSPTGPARGRAARRAGAAARSGRRVSSLRASPCGGGGRSGRSARPRAGRSRGGRPQDQVVRVLGVAVVADRHPDVVQQRGRPQQLALARRRLDHAPADQRVVQLQREPRRRGRRGRCRRRTAARGCGSRRRGRRRAAASSRRSSRR